MEVLVTVSNCGCFIGTEVILACVSLMDTKIHGVNFGLVIENKQTTGSLYNQQEIV